MNREPSNPSRLSWGILFSCGFLGLVIALTLREAGDPWCGMGWVLSGLRRAYDAIGIVLVGLLPQGIWALRLVWRQFLGPGATNRMELDYGYIARSATILGLLGTVISLGLATARLGDETLRGSHDALMRIVPLTGQALVSTATGLAIAFLAETALHFIERRQAHEA